MTETDELTLVHLLHPHRRAHPCSGSGQALSDFDANHAIRLRNGHGRCIPFRLLQHSL